MAFTLPPLPYAFDALAPHIDAQTMQIHHGKHHQAYVDNLNKAIAGGEHENKSLEELVKNAGSISPAVRNNGGSGRPASAGAGGLSHDLIDHQKIVRIAFIPNNSQLRLDALRLLDTSPPKGEELWCVKPQHFPHPST